jgi:predicted nucleic acid-binding protein
MVQLSGVRRRTLREFPKVVVDAGPLLSILVLKYAFRLDPDAANAVIDRSAIASYLRANSAQRSMIHLFDNVRGITTTSHVIGELQGLQLLKNGSQTAFWDASMNWLKTKELDESLVSLMELHSHPVRRTWVCEIGPPDCGLIELAIRQNVPLLTDDRRTLAARARQNGVDCRIVEEELSQYG